jgi:hypothetical protein
MLIILWAIFIIMVALYLDDETALAFVLAYEILP